jgi:hypothetical protein
MDRNEKIWVLAGGDSQKNVKSRLTKIDPATRKVEFSQDFSNSSAGNLVINSDRTVLYFLNKDVYRMNIKDPALPGEAFIVAGSRNFYGLDLKPDNSDVYLSDALDFSQRSNVYVYNNSGTQKKVFKAGVNANGFFFE